MNSHKYTNEEESKAYDLYSIRSFVDVSMAG